LGTRGRRCTGGSGPPLLLLLLLLGLALLPGLWLPPLLPLPLEAPALSSFSAAQHGRSPVLRSAHSRRPTGHKDTRCPLLLLLLLRADTPPPSLQVAANRLPMHCAIGRPGAAAMR
jgi:hypothetical protein